MILPWNWTEAAAVTTQKELYSMQQLLACSGIPYRTKAAYRRNTPAPPFRPPVVDMLPGGNTDSLGPYTILVPKNLLRTAQRVFSEYRRMNLG